MRLDKAGLLKIALLHGGFCALAAVGGCSEEPESYVSGRLELPRPSEYWYHDDEITGMLTLKYGVDTQRAVVRFYSSGWVQRGDEPPATLLEDMLRKSFPQLEDLSDAGSGETPLPWVAREFLTPDGFRNHVRLYRDSERYHIFEFSCAAAEFEELSGELEALTTGLLIHPPPPWESLEPGADVVLVDSVLTPAGEGWEVQASPDEILLRRGAARLLFYKRHPYLGSGEAFDLALGLRREIEHLHDEVELDDSAEYGASPFPFARQAYLTPGNWRYDAAALIDKSYYLVDTLCPADDEESRALLRESVATLRAAK